MISNNNDFLTLRKYKIWSLNIFQYKEHFEWLDKYFKLKN
jgi:hypothetical protein